MSTGVKTWDAKQLDIIVGPILVGGYADGTFVTAARDNPAYTSSTGSNGEGVRAASNDQSGTVTLTLQGESETNDALSALANADEATAAGVVPLLIKDRSGRTLIQAETAWIEKIADFEGARENTTREWVLKTNCLQMFIGGN